MDEKHLHYFKRTVEHIHRVQRNALHLVYVDRHRRTLELSNEECRQLVHAVMAHDRSKFSVEQFAGYVELTDYFATRRLNPQHEYPPGARELADAAWRNHFMVENHHPERQDVEIEQ